MKSKEIVDDYFDKHKLHDRFIEDVSFEACFKRVW